MLHPISICSSCLERASRGQPFADVTEQEAAQLLKAQPAGAFVIRFSPVASLGPLAIDIVDRRRTIRRLYLHYSEDKVCACVEEGEGG